MLGIGWFQRPHPDINKEGDLAEKKTRKREKEAEEDPYRKLKEGIKTWTV